MRKLIAAAAVVAVLGCVPGAATAQSQDPYWKQHGCAHGYTWKAAKRGVRAVMYSPKPTTKKRGAKAHKFARCVRTRDQHVRLEKAIDEGRAWRRGYDGYWWIRQQRLSPTMTSTLVRLRGCETRGIGKPPDYRYGKGADYRWDGHHKGAYQYTISTWGRAESWYGTPRRFRHWSAHVASPAHQDVVTAAFFPSHRGEWACSA